MKRNLIILRGVSGAGKTTFCNLIGGNKAICCADDFFYDSWGKYNWDGAKMKQAHQSCRDKFDLALSNPEVDNIIIANTNTKPSDWSYYENLAKEAGLTVTFVVLENRHGNKDVHNVPNATLDHQEGMIIKTLKLR